MIKLPIKQIIIIQITICLLTNLKIKANNEIPQIDSSNSVENNKDDDVIEINKETLNQLKYNIKEKIFSNNRHAIVYDLNQKKWIRLIEFTGVEVRDTKIEKNENSILKKDIWCYNAIREEWKKVDIFKYCYKGLIDQENYESKSISQNIAFIIRAGIGVFYGTNLQTQNVENNLASIRAIGSNIPITFITDCTVINIIRLGLGLTFEYSQILKIVTKNATKNKKENLKNTRVLPFVTACYKLITNLKYAVGIDLNIGYPFLYDIKNDYHSKIKKFENNKNILKKELFYFNPGLCLDYKLNGYLNLTNRISYGLHIYQIFDDSGNAKKNLLKEHMLNVEIGIRFTFGNNKFKYL